MEFKNTQVSSDQFLKNLLQLKQKIRKTLPSDVLLYHCNSCNMDIPLNGDGVLKLTKPMDKTMGEVIDENVNALMENHGKEKDLCFNNIQLHSGGTPTNLIVLLPESEQLYIKDFKIADDSYKVNLIFTKNTSPGKVICVLYHKEVAKDTTYKEFLRCNFDNFLDIEDISEEKTEAGNIIEDDDSVHNYQHDLPRLTGGGRKLGAKYNYECVWCHQDVIELGKKGRFRELRSYRKHFREFHQGDGIPITEFNESVQRSEPKWFCNVCKLYLSLGHAARHKAICEEEQNRKSTESESDSTNEEADPLAIPSVKKKREGNNNKYVGRKKKMCIYDFHTSGEETDELEEENELEYNIKVEDDNIQERTIKESKGMSSVNDKDEDYTDKKRLLLDTSVSSSDEQSHERKGNKYKKTRNISVDIEVEDEILPVEIVESSRQSGSKSLDILSTSKKDLSERAYPLRGSTASASKLKKKPQEDLEIKIEIESSTQNTVGFNKWWKHIKRNLYAKRDQDGPTIFLPKDSEEFVKRCTDRFKAHMHQKEILDKKMQESESAEAKLLQFSEERDRHILDKYTNFVQTSSAKDVMNIFSEEYETLDLQSGPKSSTATQYASRILEFFKFMSSLYHNFHLDWMVDFKKKIEKTYKDGTISNDIFLPTKNDLTEFIKKFKYGSNPAANCGLRIFAIKKLLEFLWVEMKDHEHVIEGNILEKRNIVECIGHRIKNLNESIVPSGTIKHLATASNKSHRRALLEQMAKCPERNMESIMKGVGDYVNSEEYNSQKTLLIELACKKEKIPTVKEYMNSTNWILEQLICLAGNRPCALLGITLKDWEDKKPGYCPFFQDEANDMVEDEPQNDNRKVLRNPYSKPKGSSSSEPTGVIVLSETDKIAVGQPCYIWFPNALVDLVNNHSLMAQKILPESANLYHPNTRLFLNSQGKPLKKIECKHFKNYIGIPITAYDFRRSLSTFCLESKIEEVRIAEPSVLRHREETGFAYYYQKHGEKVEYVSIQYAMKHGLIEADKETVNGYCQSLRKCAESEEEELARKRTESAFLYSEQLFKKRKQSLNDARKKGGRNWILPQEYDSFMEGIEEAIRMEDSRKQNNMKPGPFSNLLKYKPGADGAGIFPGTDIWQMDMYRVLYGLAGDKGDAMRKAELSVYDGVPFSEGLSGRKKIAQAIGDDSGTDMKKDAETIVANYWREKIKAEARQIYQGKWLPLRFLFTEKEFGYYLEQKQKVKTEIE